MTSTTRSASRTRGGPMSSLRFAPFAQLLSWLSLASKVYRERQALLALDERSLRDIGLSRADAYYEGSRAFWDIPQHR